MKRGALRPHYSDPRDHRGQCRRRGPRIRRGLFTALVVVEVELGDKRLVDADLFAALREPFHVPPTRLHVFVFHVAQPPAENGKPVAVSHRGPPLAATRSPRFASCRCTSASRKSPSRASGSKPIPPTGPAPKWKTASP